MLGVMLALGILLGVVWVLFDYWVDLALVVALAGGALLAWRRRR